MWRTSPSPKDRSRAYGIIGAAFGLGFILGPALSGVLAPVSYTAPIWAAAGITAVATLMAMLLAARDRASRHGVGPDCRLRRLGAMMRRPQAAPCPGDRLRLLAGVRGLSDHVRALCRAPLRVRCAAQTGYFFAAFGVLGAVVQGVLIRPIVGRLGDKSTFILGLVCSTVGLVAATLTPRSPCSRWR